MQRRGAGRVAASAGSALFLTLMTSAAQASGHLPFGPPPEFGSGTAIAFGIIFPTEVGSFVSGSGANFLFGWSWQIPISLDLHSRIAGGVDLALGPTSILCVGASVIGTEDTLSSPGSAAPSPTTAMRCRPSWG